MSTGNGAPKGGARLPRVRPYPLAELPRLLRVQVDLSRALFRHLSPVLDSLDGAAPLDDEELGDEEPGAAGGGWSAVEAALGPLTLSAQEPYLFPDSGTAARVQGGVAVELELLGPAPRRAVLVVDEGLVPDGDPEALSGVLAQVFAGTEVRVGGPVPGREVSGVLAPTGGMVLGLDLLLRGEEGGGWARLLCGADLRLAVPPPAEGRARRRLLARSGRLAAVPAELRIEAGQGVLPAAEAAALAPGDVVLLDQFGPRPVMGGPVRLRLGRGAFPAHLDGDGVTVTGPFHLAGPAGLELTKSRTGTMGKDTSDKSDAERLLRELPVQLTCEIGRITLSGRELLELRPGAVLPVGRPLSGPVDLCAGDRVIARGELVDVEGEIGVRVTELMD